MNAVPQRRKAQIDELILGGISADRNIIRCFSVRYDRKKLFISGIRAYMPQEPAALAFAQTLGVLEEDGHPLGKQDRIWLVGEGLPEFWCGPGAVYHIKRPFLIGTVAV